MATYDHCFPRLRVKRVRAIVDHLHRARVFLASVMRGMIVDHMLDPQPQQPTIHAIV